MNDNETFPEINALLERAMWSLVSIKRRYPLLLKTIEKIEHVRTRSRHREFHNDALVQILRDSFDMLVIDLASLREGITQRSGLLDSIRKSPRVLRARSPQEFDHPARELLAQGAINALNRLGLGLGPFSRENIDDLIDRFRAETEPIDRDRNRVRAHRFERASQGGGQVFIPLPALGGQIQVFGAYLSDLYLVVTGMAFDTSSSSFASSVDGTADDLADIIIHGSINSATIEYGLVSGDLSSSGAHSWYWSCRARSLEALPTETSS